MFKTTRWKTRNVRFVRRENRKGGRDVVVSFVLLTIWIVHKRQNGDVRAVAATAEASKAQTNSKKQRREKRKILSFRRYFFFLVFSVSFVFRIFVWVVRRLHKESYVGTYFINGIHSFVFLLVVVRRKLFWKRDGCPESVCVFVCASVFVTAQSFPKRIDSSWHFYIYILAFFFCSFLFPFAFYFIANSWMA